MGRTRLLFRANAITSGYNDHLLKRMCDEGDLRRVRPGIYMMPGEGNASDPVARHTTEIHAAMAKQRTPGFVSHASAAVLHGIPVWDIDLSRVHITQPGSAGGHTSPRRHQHMSYLGADQVTEVDGLPVTSVARTVVDLARTVRFTRAVAAGDAALNNALTTVDELLTEIALLRGKCGSGRAAAAVRAMDPRSESPGETLSRIIMDRDGLPRRELQRVIRVDGVMLGRVDFYFGEPGIVGEFDGRIKYQDRADGRDVGRTPHEIIWQEKQREDALRAAGLEVVRWTWADLHSPGRLTELFDAARDRTAGRPAPRIDPPDPRDSYIPCMKLTAGDA